MNRKLTQTGYIMAAILAITTIAFSYVLTRQSEDLAPVPVQRSLIEATKPAEEQIAITETSAEETLQPILVEANNTPAPTPAQSNFTVEAPVDLVEDEGAPEGYIDPPPQCGQLWWSSPHGDPNMEFTTKIRDWQTDVVVSQYHLYVNGSLVDSSSTNTLNYTAPGTGTYNVYSIMDTNFGTTLKSTLCEYDIEVDEFWAL